MDPWLLCALMALSTWRLARLVTADEFPPIRWARDRILGRGPEWLGDLVTCSWCASVWLAAGVVGLTDAFSSVPRPLLAFGAAAALSPILSVLVERWDRVTDLLPIQGTLESTEPQDESEMATMVTLERQVVPNSHVSG